MERRYETVFITTPVLSEEQMKETVDKFKDLMKDNVTIIHEELGRSARCAHQQLHLGR